MGKIIFNIVLIIIVLLVACAVWPFYVKSRVNYDLKTAASYGTKHSIEETREFLVDALEERGVTYDPENLFIEKSSRNTVTIRYNVPRDVGRYVRFSSLILLLWPMPSIELSSSPEPSIVKMIES